MAPISIVAFVGAVIFYFASLYVYVPILPAFVSARTPSLAAVGFVLSMYGLWTALLRIPTGIAADATGRNRIFLTIGAILSAGGAAVMLVSRSTASLAFGRALTGASVAAWVPMLTVFAGYFEPHRAVFATSLLSFASSLGQMIATVSTGFIDSLGGYGLTFIVAVGFSIAASLIFVVIKLPKVRISTSERLSLGSILAVARRKDVLVPSVTNAVCQFGIWALVFGFMPLLARSVGASVTVAGLLVTLYTAAYMTASLLTALIADRGHRRGILYLGFTTFAGGALLAALGGTTSFLFVSTVLMGMANGVDFPTLLGLSIQHVKASRRSTAMGIHQALYAIGMFTGPWVGGILADAFGLRPMFVIVAAFSSIAAGSLVLLYRGLDSPASAT